MNGFKTAYQNPAWRTFHKLPVVSIASEILSLSLQYHRMHRVNTARVKNFVPTAIFVATLLTAFAAGSTPPGPAWKRALDEAARAAPDARILVLDVHDGHLLASQHLDQAARTLAAPGSTLKPIILYQLLKSGRWDPGHRIACDRSLVVAGHPLTCSHPPALAFDARAALAWSCNSYFAAVAQALHAGELGATLRPTGLLSATGLASGEAVAEFEEPRTPAQTQLALLGVDFIRVTPLELASAYRWLAIELGLHDQSPAARTIRGGLTDSAESGMAQAAHHDAISVAGKTGTAESTGSFRTHGWFAGFAPATNPDFVIVVYVPGGRGADAANIAGRLLVNALINKPKAKQP